MGLMKFGRSSVWHGHLSPAKALMTGRDFQRLDMGLFILLGGF